MHLGDQQDCSEEAAGRQLRLGAVEGMRHLKLQKLNFSQSVVSILLTQEAFVSPSRLAHLQWDIGIGRGTQQIQSIMSNRHAVFAGWSSSCAKIISGAGAFASNVLHLIKCENCSSFSALVGAPICRRVSECRT